MLTFLSAEFAATACPVRPEVFAIMGALTALTEASHGTGSLLIPSSFGNQWRSAHRDLCRSIETLSAHVHATSGRWVSPGFCINLARFRSWSFQIRTYTVFSLTRALVAGGSSSPAHGANDHIYSDGAVVAAMSRFTRHCALDNLRPQDVESG